MLNNGAGLLVLLGGWVEGGGGRVDRPAVDMGQCSDLPPRRVNDLLATPGWARGVDPRVCGRSLTTTPTQPFSLLNFPPTNYFAPDIKGTY